MQVVVSRATHIDAPATGHERQGDFAGTVRHENAGIHRNAGVLFRCLEFAFTGFAFEVFLLKLGFELAERRVDGNSFREDINVSFYIYRSQRAITTVVDMIDRGG